MPANGPSFPDGVQPPTRRTPPSLLASFVRLVASFSIRDQGPPPSFLFRAKSWKYDSISRPFAAQRSLAQPAPAPTPGRKCAAPWNFSPRESHAITPRGQNSNPTKPRYQVYPANLPCPCLSVQVTRSKPAHRALRSLAQRIVRVLPWPQRD